MIERLLPRSRGPALAAFASVLLIPSAAHAQAPGQEAAGRLAAKFSPITMVREQKDPPCDSKEEQYQPTSVETVLDNPRVSLDRDVPGKGTKKVKQGPGIGDIDGLGERYYLNLPGDPLGTTCVYAKDFRTLERENRAPVVTYAHIAREEGHDGFALQYFFYWYFNVFNDLHESDWEGMQLTFDAASPEQALAEGKEPDRMILFQHAGGERGHWDDAKVEKEGTHPVVYPAAGSHATFYSSTVFVENGGHGSGLGCDNTSEPLRELHPRPVMLPDQAPADGPFAWLNYYGRWGQKESGFNNGPTGPQTKHQWTEPFTWMEAQRPSSVQMPGGSIVGPAPTNAFCSTVADISSVLNLKAKASAATIALLVVGAVGLLLLFGFTRWWPVELEPLRARRTYGQIVRAARRLYGRHWRVLVGVAATAMPLVLGSRLLASAVSTSSVVLESLGQQIDAVSRPIVSAVVAAVVIAFVKSLVDTGQAGFAGSWRLMSARFWRVVGAQLFAQLALIAIAATIIGLPVAVRKLIDWTFVQQEVLFEDKSIREALSGSSDLVRGRWWHTVRVVLVFYVIGIVTGPILTFGLFFTTIPLIWANLIGSAVFALLMPFIALGETLLYFDVGARAASEPVTPRRDWRPWRPRSFGRPALSSDHADGGGPRPSPSAPPGRSFRLG